MTAVPTVNSFVLIGIFKTKKPANGVTNKIKSKPIRKYYNYNRRMESTGQYFNACLTELVSNFNPEIIKIIKMQIFAKGVFDITTPK